MDFFNIHWTFTTSASALSEDIRHVPGAQSQESVLREEYQYSSCNSYLQTLFSKLNQMQAILMMKRFHLRIKVCKYKHPHYRQDQPYSICKITSHLKPLYFSIYPFQKIMMTKRHSQSIKYILGSITFSNLMNTYCRV